MISRTIQTMKTNDKYNKSFIVKQAMQNLNTSANKP